MIVQFGSKKVLTGIIALIHRRPPENYEAKYILEQLEPDPLVHDIQLRLFDWIANYYMCTVGEVLNVALPSGLKLSSQSRIQKRPEFDLGDSPYQLSDHEFELLSALENNQSLTYGEAGELLRLKQIHPVLKSLIQKDAILIFEEIKDKYTPKREKRIRLSPHLLEEEDLEEILSSLEKKPKQADVLLKYLHLIPVLQDRSLNQKGIDQADLTKGDLSRSSIKTLIKNKILDEFEVIVPRFEPDKIQPTSRVTLTTDQLNAKKEILLQFETKETILLQGVTGSGKTELYIDLIQNALSGGSQVLYLLPEIALTTHIVGRLRAVFGDQLGVYHSRFSDNERVEIWKGVLSGQFQFVIGVRSALYLPFDNLGLVVVDEEHENSYKQYDPAPRYHARDLAIVLAGMHHAKTVLGSATPSLESYYNALSGKYGWVHLPKRFGDSQMPEIILADLKLERNKKRLRGEFTPVLIEALERVLESREQAIIFQNRRGYAPFLTCMECGDIPKCENCAVSLTYHLYSEELRCHYCGFRARVPSRCKACGSTKVVTRGYGTEKLEVDLAEAYPEAKIVRMDLDTTRTKLSYQRILQGFDQQEIDILVGTQMVTKGLDFDHVSLVGVFDADRMIHFPDFRSYEKAFQLITQVSGRAGRRKKKGTVIIQTNNLNQPIFRMIIDQDLKTFYELELSERAKFKYPPYYRLVKIITKNRDREENYSDSWHLFRQMEKAFPPNIVSEPHEPLIPRIRNQFRMELLLRFKREKVDLKAAKKLILIQIEECRKSKQLKNTGVVLDVDPY